MRVSLIPLVTVVVLALSIIFAAFTLTGIMGGEMRVKVRHFCVKGDDSWRLGFTIESPVNGTYRYAMAYNSSLDLVSFSDTGNLEAGNSFTYTVNVTPEQDKTLLVNIKVWWGEQLIDEINHYVKP